MVTIADVARRAQASIGSVSSVLNGRPTVSAALRERVLQAAQELGYAPNRAARQLATPERRLFLVLRPSWLRTHYPAITILSGMERAAREVSGSLVVSTVGDEAAADNLGLEYIRRRRDQVGGVVLMGTRLDDPILDEVRAAALPCVVVNRLMPQEGRVSFVSADHRLARAIAVDHLLSLGHRCLLYVGGDAGNSSYQDGLAGCREALGRAGVRFGAEHLFPDVERAAAALAAAGADGPTAAVAHSDAYAAQLLAALARQGVAVPGEVSVVGVDDAEPSASTDPPLTTVGYSALELGFQAITLVNELATNADVLAHGVILRPHLVRRRSTGPRAVAPGRPSPDGRIAGGSGDSC